MKIFIAFLFMLLLFPVFANAKFYDVETTGEYIMGDNDTKLEARRMALEHAKVLAVEKMGTYLESESVVKENRLAKDEVRTYSSAIVKTTVISEDVNLLENKTTVFKIRIKASVDIDVLEKKIKEMKSDTKRREQIAALQAENIRLLKELESLSVKINKAKTTEYKNLRQERETIFEKLEKNQNSIRVVFEKGSLLSLALQQKNKFEETEHEIHNFLQFVADNTKVDIIKTSVDYDYSKGEFYFGKKEETASILVDIVWRVERLEEALEKLSSFCSFKSKGASEINIVSFNNYKIGDYFEKQSWNLYIKITPENYKNSKEQRIIWCNIWNKSFHTTGKNTVKFYEVPIEQLDKINNIEARVVYENPERKIEKNNDKTKAKPNIRKKW